MIIGNSYVMGIIFYPPKNNSPLIVNSYAPKTFEVPKQFFEPIPRWYAKKAQKGSSIDLVQQTSCFSMEFTGKFSRVSAVRAIVYVSGDFISKSLDHFGHISYIDIPVKKRNSLYSEACGSGFQESLKAESNQ